MSETVPHIDQSTLKERLLFDIEQSLGVPRQSEFDTNFSIDAIAEKGKSGVTTLYASCFEAIDAMPKVFEPRRFGKTGLSNEARDLFETLDMAIELNPLFNRTVYSEAKQALNRFDYERSPEGFFTEPSHKTYFPERCLGALHNGVEAGFTKRRSVSSAWSNLVPQRVIKTMELNGSLDTDVYGALQSAKDDRNYPAEDYISALTALSKESAHQILNPPKRSIVGSYANGLEQKSVSYDVATALATGTIGTVVGEAALILAYNSPSVTFAIGSFIGSISVQAYRRATR